MKKFLATAALLSTSFASLSLEAQSKESFPSLIMNTLQKTTGKELVSYNADKEEGQTFFGMIGGFVYYTDTTKNGQFQSEAEYSVKAWSTGVFDEKTFDISHIDSAEIVYRTTNPTGDGVNEKVFLAQKAGNSYTLRNAHFKIIKTAAEILAEVPPALKQQFPSMNAEPVKEIVPDKAAQNYADMTAILKAVSKHVHQQSLAPQ